MFLQDGNVLYLYAFPTGGLYRLWWCLWIKPFLVVYHWTPVSPPVARIRQKTLPMVTFRPHLCNYNPDPANTRALSYIIRVS